MQFLLGLLPDFLKVLLGIGQGAVEDQQTRADRIALGQDQQAATDLKAAVAAQQRIDTAGALPTTTAEDLRNGKF